MFSVFPQLPPVPTPSPWIILDFLMEILIIHSLPHWIPTQGISIRMPHSWSMDYLEVVVLQQVNPSTPSSMGI
jgi:hypothetical protein